MQRRLLPDLGLLQTFESAARHGNFSHAAYELNLTQSAVSRQIKELEGQIGQRLFERVRQRVVLSNAGRQVLPEVRTLLAEAERLMLEKLSADPDAQQLSICTLPTFGARWLIPRLPSFHALYPDVVVSLEDRDQMVNLQEDAFDLMIHFGRPVWPDAVSDFLCTEIVVPVASARLAEQLAISKPEDLLDAPLLHMTNRPMMWRQWFERYANQSTALWKGSRFSQFSMIISAIESDQGVGLLPSYLIEQELARGDMVQLLDAPMETDNAYYIVVPENRQSNQAALQFHEWLLGQVSERSRMRRAEMVGGKDDLGTKTS